VIPPPAFLLLGRDRDPAGLLSPPQCAAWQLLGGRSAHFGPGGLTDTDGKYTQWFDRLNTSVVLIRPDFQVFGGAHDPHTADRLVQDLPGASRRKHAGTAESRKSNRSVPGW
jgi:hypothetical protein